MVAVVLVLAVVLLANPAVAKDKKKAIESYKGNVMATTAGAGGSSMGEFRIYRWSTDDERDEILSSIKDATGKANANREVAKTLRGQAKAGYVFMAAKTGYPIRYTRQFETETGRQIIMATDRPVSFGEAYSASRLGDFDVTVIILTFPKDGKAEGIISVGTEVVWNEEKQKIEVTNVSSQPIKVLDLRSAD